MKGTLGGHIACWKQTLENEVKEIKHKRNDLEKELEIKNQLLTVSEGKYHSLERELCVLKQDHDAVLQRTSSLKIKKQTLENEVEEVKLKNNDLEKELEVKNQLLKDSEGKYHSLEREFHLLKDDRDAELQRASSLKSRKQALENEVEEIKVQYSDSVKELEVKSQLLEASEGKYDSLEREFRILKEDQDVLLERISSLKTKKQALENEVEEINLKFNKLEKELDVKTHILKVSEGRYDSLEREFHLLREDRDSVIQRSSSSSQMLTQISGEKERVLKDLNSEVRMRKKLEEEIKQFSVAFACRQRSITSFHSEFKSVLETMKAHNLTSLSKSHGS